jgi:hypothetical protein
MELINHKNLMFSFLFVSVLNQLHPISIYIVYISVLFVVFHMMNVGKLLVSIKRAMNSSRIELLWLVWDQSQSKYYLRTTCKSFSYDECMMNEG